MRAILVLGLVSLSLVTACGDDQPRVPFGLETQATPSTALPTSAPTPLSTEWPAGAAVRIDELPLSLAGTEIRATLVTDLNGDARRDVVFLAVAADGAIALGTATRNAEALTVASTLPIAAACAPIAIASARILWLSSDLVAARIERTCSASSEQRVAVVRVGASSRLLEQIVFAPATGEALTVRSEDRDSDGHADVVLHVALHDPNGESADVDLAWLDRAAGLSRDTAEPEATVSVRATEARNALRRHPDRALAAAHTAILVHDALCGPSARLVVGDDSGLGCPSSAGLGRALAIVVAAEARREHLPEAILALAALSRSDATVRDADRALARDALAAMDGVAHPAPHEGPAAHGASGGDTPRLSTLAFLSEDRVLVRGERAHVLTLSTGASEPSIDGDVTMADASRAHHVAEIERACGGYVVVVRPIFGPLDSPSLAHTLALIEARPPPPGAFCNELSPSAGVEVGASIAQRSDSGGWHALGWAPQGVLVARESVLVLVPVDIAGASVGPPVTLAPGDPAPAPIAAGHASADASAWALTNAVGVVLYRRGANPTLVMPATFTRADGLAIDVAVSPSAQRLAWIEGGRVRWVDLTEPPPPPPTTTTP